jgi:predicted methyltransferase
VARPAPAQPEGAAAPPAAAAPGRAGTGITESGILHCIEEAFLRAEVERAGFRLLEEGHFLRNPADPRDKNTPDPPMPKDEFVLKFVKP